jgi:hypothetical protein
MRSSKPFRRNTTTFPEGFRQELGFVRIIVLGSLLLAQAVMGSEPDPSDIAAYRTAREAELDTYDFRDQQKDPSIRVALDKLAQDLSGTRGVLEDKLVDQGYFDE